METFTFDFKNDAEWNKYENLCTKIQYQVGGKDNISVLVNNVEEMEAFNSKLHKKDDLKIL